MEDISVKELKERLANKEQLNIIDVREQHEYDDFNIEATLIPLGDLTNKLEQLEQYKNEELIIHCRSGARSGQAKVYLENQGFTKVRNLLGGMLEWQETE